MFLVLLLSICPVGRGCGFPLGILTSRQQSACRRLPAALDDSATIVPALSMSLEADSSVGMPNMTHLRSSLSAWALATDSGASGDGVGVLQASSDRLADNTVVALVIGRCLWGGGLRGRDILPDRAAAVQARWNALIPVSGRLRVSDNESAVGVAQLFMNYLIGRPTAIESSARGFFRSYGTSGSLGVLRLSQTAIERTNSGWRMGLQWPSQYRRRCRLTIRQDGSVADFALARGE